MISIHNSKKDKLKKFSHGLTHTHTQSNFLSDTTKTETIDVYGVYGVSNGVMGGRCGS